MSDPSDKLDWVTSGERRGLSHAYTVFVKAMRVVLPLAAIAMTAVIVLWDDMGEKMTKADEAKLRPEMEQARGELLEPKFDSTDSDGRPYSIKAARAQQDKNNPKVMVLESPDAIIHLDDAQNLTGKSAKGSYEQEAGRLYLSGAVIFEHSNGYNLTSDELRIDLKTGAVYSDLPVRASGNMGVINATGLEARQEDGVLIFKGPATLVLTQADGVSIGGEVR